MTLRGSLGARGNIGGAIAVGAGKSEPFLYATTAAPAQTVTIHRITPTGGNITIYWGDGGTTVVAAGVTTAQAHVYAAAGMYEIRVDPLSIVTRLDIHDAKLSGFKSAQIAANAMTQFTCYSIGATVSNVINSANMATWNPDSWILYSMPVGTYTINSADMATWNPATWNLFSMPAGTYTINSANMATWNPDSWSFASMSAGTYTINSANMATWNPITWILFSMPVGTYTINSANMATWNPATWYIYLMPAASTTWTIAANDFSGFTKTTAIRAYDNALNQTQVNAILWGMYQASATPRTGVNGTINVAGTNAAPSGIYQPATACPVSVATPGKEVANELKNDGCGVGFNKWATVTIS